MRGKTGLEVHASMFGSDGVIETAVELGYSVEAVAKLIEHCDKADIALAKKRKRFVTAKKHRLSYEERARRALGIPTEEEGER